jgi:hypothetical protein
VEAAGGGCRRVAERRSGASLDLVSTPTSYLVCASCGRHLLRGEEPEIFLHDGERREVCELCVPRALHAGWIRIGVGDALTLEPERGPSLLDRLRRARGGRRGGRSRPTPARASGTRRRRPDPDVERPDDRGEVDLGVPAPSRRHIHTLEDELGITVEEEQHASPLAAHGTTATGDRAQVISAGARMAARAIDLYNHSPHPRTLSGIARSLGAPWVTIRGVGDSRMRIVVAWELTWYRFELDLAREGDGVHVLDQGTALAELDPGDVEPNAVADEHGYLYLGSGQPAQA